MNPFNPRILATALVLTLSACANDAQSTTDAPAGAAARQGEIEQLLADHQVAWNAHDADGLAAQFADDGTLVTPTGNRVAGRDAIRQVMASPGPTKQTQSRVELDGVQWLGEGLAVVDATQTLTGPGVDQLGTDRAKLVAVVRRDADGWQFVAARPFPVQGR